jgi:hypothetical protein
MTKAMKFTHERPAEALKILQARFPNFDPAILQKAWPNYIKGIPDSPVITRAYYDNTLRWLNISAKTAVKTSYEEVVMNDVAVQAAKDILGK